VDGSNCSDMKNHNSLIGQITKLSLSMERKTRKAKQLSSMATRIEETRDGELCILIKQKLLKQRDSTRNSDSISIDLSISDQDSQCKELLSATVPTMSGLEDGERTLLPNNGTSMRSQRPSRTTNGSHTHLISKETEDLPTLDAQPLIQDGGNYSRKKALS